MRSNRAKSAGEMHLLKNDISEKYDGDGGQPHIGGRGLLVYDVIMSTFVLYCTDVSFP